MKDVRWIHAELHREFEPFASYRIARRVLAPATLVHDLSLAAQVAQATAEDGKRFGDAVALHLGSEVGLWFHAGWHDQASLQVFDVKKGDGRLTEHMLAKLDKQQPAENGDMIWGFASITDDWVLLLHVSRERRSFHATLRATTVEVADLVWRRV